MSIPPAETTRESDEARIRVLVVDDEPSYRGFLERYLTREGYQVQTAANASEALSAGRSFEPHVVLADWMLKDQMHGLEVAESLREGSPDLRILLMTGFPSTEIRKEAARAKVFRFLEKPFGLDELAAAIREAAS